MNKKLNRIVSSMFVLLSATLLLSSCNVEEAFEGGLVGEDRVGVSAVGVDRSRDVVLRRVGVGLRDYALASQVAVLEQTGNLSDISGLAPGEITLNAGAFGTGVDVSGASEFISSAYCVDDDGLGYQVSYVSSRDGDGASFVRGLGRSQGASIAQGLLGDFSRGNLGVAGTNGKIALLNNASTTVPASCDADIPVGAAVIVLEGLSASAQFDEDESRIVYRSIDCIDTGFTGRILQQAVLRRDSDGNLSGGKTENGIVTQANIEGDLAATSASEEDVLEWIDVQQNCFEAGNNALVSSFADVTSVASQGVSDLSGANTALANATEIEIQCQGVLDGTALSSSEQAILTGDDAGARADLLAANPDLAQYQNCLGSEGQVELAEYQTSELGVMVCTGHPSLASFTPGNSIFPAIDADQFINPQHIIGIYTRDTLLPRGISSTGTNTSGEAEGTSSFFEWAVDCTWSEQLVISCGDIASVLGFDSSYQLTPASSSAITYTRQASVNSFAGSNVTQSETPPALGTITRSNVGAPSGTCIWERITNANGSCPIGETPAGGEPFITETETITVTSGINTPAPTTTVTTSSTPECEAFNCTAPEFLNVSTNTCETCPDGTQVNAAGDGCEPVVNGQCGSANGIETPSAPSSNLCSIGTATTVSDNGSSYSWTCNGSGSGASNASCSAPKEISGFGCPDNVISGGHSDAPLCQPNGPDTDCALGAGECVNGCCLPKDSDIPPQTCTLRVDARQLFFGGTVSIEAPISICGSTTHVSTVNPTIEMNVGQTVTYNINSCQNSSNQNVPCSGTGTATCLSAGAITFSATCNAEGSADGDFN